MKEPIIIVGMHRSGTSLLARILEDLGVFMGKRLDENHESKFFQDLNKWIYSQLGGRWDFPPNINYILLNNDINSVVVEYLKQSIIGPKFIKYLGAYNYIFNKKYITEQNLWGWKDPRNVYTIPIWLQIFPDAKIIYIERHGVDVANSLRKRSLKGMNLNISRYKNNKWMYLFRSKSSGFSHSTRCCKLDGGFTLWEDYISEGRKNMESIQNNQIMALNYEDLLANPQLALDKIVDFLQIKNSKELIEKIGVNIKPGRAYAYKENPELQEYSEKVSNNLEKYEDN